MGNANSLKFGQSVNYYEGVVVEDRGDIVTLDVKGRLGYFELTKDMFLKQYPFKLGQVVCWKMSFLEQLPARDTSLYVRGVMNPDNTMYMEGVVSLVEDCAISIDIKDDQGFFKAPMRMYLSDVPFEVGQTVGWNMSMIVQTSPDADDKYVSNIHNRENRAIEISNRNN